LRSCSAIQFSGSSATRWSERANRWIIFSESSATRLLMISRRDATCRRLGSARVVSSGCAVRASSLRYGGSAAAAARRRRACAPAATSGADDDAVRKRPDDETATSGTDTQPATDEAAPASPPPTDAAAAARSASSTETGCAVHWPNCAALAAIHERSGPRGCDADALPGRPHPTSPGGDVRDHSCADFIFSGRASGSRYVKSPAYRGA